MKVSEKISAKLNYFELCRFGLELLSDDEVEGIQGNCSDTDLKKLCLEILKAWKGGKDHASWDDVVGALRNIRKREVARIIEEAKEQSSTQLGKRSAEKRGKL